MAVPVESQEGEARGVFGGRVDAELDPLGLGYQAGADLRHGRSDELVAALRVGGRHVGEGQIALLAGAGGDQHGGAALTRVLEQLPARRVGLGRPSGFLPRVREATDLPWE